MALLSRLPLYGQPISVLLCGLGVLGVVAALLLQSRSHERRLKKLGGRAPAVASHLPFGMDLLYRLMQTMQTHTFFEFVRESLDGSLGRTVEIKIAGSRLLLTDEVENIKAIQLSKFSDFGKGERLHKIFENIWGDSVFSTDGALWMKNKDELRPHLAKSRPDDIEITEQHLQRLFAHFRKGKPLEVYDLIDRFQLDMGTHIFLGESTCSLDQEEQPAFGNALLTLSRVASTRLLMGPLAGLFPDWLVARKALQEFSTYMDRRVNDTLAMPKAELLSKDRKMNLMETLAIKQPNRRYIRDQLTAVLLASKDPVAIVLSWLIYELSRRRDVFEQIEREVQEKLGFEKAPTLEMLKDCTVLKNCVKETLRMYHPIGINIREALVDTCLPTGGGKDGREPVAILKGEQVAYTIMTSQRREAVIGFPDGDVWNPSRWETWTPSSYQYVPFNTGPRICLGRVFAHAQMEYTVARLVQDFERIEWCGYGGVAPDEEEMRIKVELNTKFDKPIMCRFTTRQG